MVKAVKQQSHRPDFILLTAVLILVLFGLLMVYNASPVTSLRDFGDPLRLIKLQSIWAGAGLLAGLVILRIPYSFWQKISPVLMLLGLSLLAAVFIPGLGVKVYGAQRWIDLGFTTIQPAEFAKLAFILYLSALLSKKEKLTYFLIPTLLTVAIVIAQKDLGTSIIITVIGLTIYFVAGAPWRYFLVMVPIMSISVSALVLSTAYRRERFLAFLNPAVDPEGISYHIYQSLIAIGAGGWAGVGLGQSRQKYGFIPEVTTDSIFAVVGNEIGFVGAFILVVIYAIVIYRGFRIAIKAPDRFSQLAAAGIATWIGVQALINIGGLVALLPLTGVTLPFISYGGSSLVSTLIAAAILLNISRYTAKESHAR